MTTDLEALRWTFSKRRNASAAATKSQDVFPGRTAEEL